jgi:conjugal transfer ATP-binding protein TraC
MPAPSIARQIIEAGPIFVSRDPRSFSAIRSRAASRPRPRPPDHRRARQPPAWAACAGAPRTAIRSAAFPLLPLGPVRSFPVRDPQARANPLGAEGGGSFAVEVGKQIEEIGWILDEASNSRFVSVIPTMWVFGRDSAQARDGRPAKRLWNPNPFLHGAGGELSASGAARRQPAFRSLSREAHLKLLERDFRMPVKAATLMAPVQTDFRGGGRPALLYVGRKGQLVTLDLFDPRINNYNFVVSAESGAGKSFLLNNLCQQYYAQGALIRIIDIGGSYRKLCTLCSGRYIDIGEERLVLNPFDMGLALDGEDKQSAIAMAVAIVAEMANASTRKPVTTSEWNLLKSAVQWTVDSGRGEDGIDAVRDWLGAIPTMQSPISTGSIISCRSRANWRSTCAISGRMAYGHFFNGPSTFDISRDEFVVLELERLKALPDLFNVIVMVVVNAVTQELYLSARDKPRFVLCDEAAQFMTRSDGQDLSRLAEAFGQGIAARKYQGSFGIVLQSMNDLLLFGGTGQVILENAATRFLLQGSTYDKAVDNKILDYSGFVLDLLKSVRNAKPITEVFIDSPLGSASPAWWSIPSATGSIPRRPMRSPRSRRWCGQAAIHWKRCANWPASIRSRCWAVVPIRREGGMMPKSEPHPDQLAIDWEQDPAIEAIIEARVAKRAEAAAFQWRLRLAAIETCMMGGLVIAAGLALDQPPLRTVRTGFIVAAACFASGMLLIGLSAPAGCSSRACRNGGRDEPGP